MSKRIVDVANPEEIEVVLKLFLATNRLFGDEDSHQVMHILREDVDLSRYATDKELLWSFMTKWSENGW